MQFASSRPGSPRTMAATIAQKANENTGPSNVVSMLEAKVSGA